MVSIHMTGTIDDNDLEDLKEDVIYAKKLAVD